MCHFEYDPKNASNVLPAGEYDATIKSVIDTDKDGAPLRSDKGRGEDMICVVFTVYSERGERTIRCYITAKGGLFRYRQIAHALGKAQDFSDKKFKILDYIGHNLRLKLAIDPPKGQYDEQNSIEQVLPAAIGTPATRPLATAGAKDDDIPF